MKEISSKYTNNNIYHDKKTCNRNIRLSEDEEKTITEKAKAANTSFSRYVIDASIGRESFSCRWRSEMLCNLCELYELAQDIENTQIRKQIMDWGQRQWQYLK